MKHRYEARVERGAKWLDETAGPDWWSEIEVASLNMQSCSYCILGQLFGHYTYVTSIDKVALGFTTDSPNNNKAHWDILKRLWLRQLNLRANW